MTIQAWIALAALFGGGGLIASLVGIGKAYGLMLGEVRAGNTLSAEALRKVEGLGKSIDRFKGETRREVRFLRETDAELGTRVALVEQLAGLPAPWKRTQPIRPVAAESGQDMFPEDDQG